MKIRLLFMIIFSVCMGIPTDIATFTLYGSEFSSVFGMIKTHVFTTSDYIIWMLLLASHAGVVLLPFLLKKEYFKRLLITIPLLFIIFYVMLEGVFILFLLIPFFMVWMVCLDKLRDRRTQ